MARQKSQPLSDPVWSETPDHCLWCSYPLVGLTAPGRCPECGVWFDAHVLTLCGVPASSAGAPVWRRAAWLAVIGAGLIYFYVGWAFLLFISPILAGATGLAILGALVVLVVISPRERRGAERFIFTHRGVVRAPLKQGRHASGADTILIPYDDANAVELKRVSFFWRKLRIGVASGRGARMSGFAFRAGVRCPDDYEERVRHHIEALLQAAREERSDDPSALLGSLHAGDSAH
ncbi:MAG: hypothetical protein EA376_01985 [Phycisphaeraceae bacterium]|nr:MAG: hypothetical protein EA376_01985 [Phycisphaeraceae bacterium]